MPKFTSFTDLSEHIDLPPSGRMTAGEWLFIATFVAYLGGHVIVGLWGM